MRQAKLLSFSAQEYQVPGINRGVPLLPKYRGTRQKHPVPPMPVTTTSGTPHPPGVTGPRAPGAFYSGDGKLSFPKSRPLVSISYKTSRKPVSSKYNVFSHVLTTSQDAPRPAHCATYGSSGQPPWYPRSRRFTLNYRGYQLLIPKLRALGSFLHMVSRNPLKILYIYIYIFSPTRWYTTSQHHDTLH